jgi:hypothetical protein
MDYIMDTSLIVKRKDEEEFNGDYGTKRVILEIYDDMQESIRTGQGFQSRLDPPVADPRLAHPPRQRVVQPAVQVAKVLPFRRIEKPSETEKYKTCVPILTLKAAAGGFSDWQTAHYDEWAEVPTRLPLRRGMFVAQVVGHSMEPQIPDGAWCLFSRPVLHIRQDIIGLVQSRDISDPDTGGNYTIKRIRRLKGITADGTEGYTAVQLEPVNPGYPVLELQQTSDDDVRVVAEFVEVIGQ